MPRRFIRSDNWEFGEAPADPADVTETPKPRKRRLAATLIFTTVFFSGASLAAVAGDKLAYVASDTPDQSASAQPTGNTPDASASAQPSGADVAVAPDATAAPAAAPDAVTPDTSVAQTDATAQSDPAAAAPTDATSGQVTNDAVRPTGPSASPLPATQVAPTGRPVSSAAKKARLARAK
ncbi:MAG TPA: hypothetical protein VF025_10355, partial [Gaiellaceae bacterium]